jgi:hypothetical protein
VFLPGSHTLNGTSWVLQFLCAERFALIQQRRQQLVPFIRNRLAGLAVRSMDRDGSGSFAPTATALLAPNAGEGEGEGERQTPGSRRHRAGGGAAADPYQLPIYASGLGYETGQVRMASAWAFVRCGDRIPDPGPVP